MIRNITISESVQEVLQQGGHFIHLHSSSVIFSHLQSSSVIFSHFINLQSSSVIFSQHLHFVHLTAVCPSPSKFFNHLIICLHIFFCSSYILNVLLIVMLVFDLLHIKSSCSLNLHVLHSIKVLWFFSFFPSPSKILVSRGLDLLCICLGFSESFLVFYQVDFGFV